MTSLNNRPISRAQKEWWYDQGNYLMPPPPVYTRDWGRHHWIEYIDLYGIWNPQAPKTITFNHQTWEFAGFSEKGEATYRLPGSGESSETNTLSFPL